MRNNTWFGALMMAMLFAPSAFAQSVGAAAPTNPVYSNDLPPPVVTPAEQDNRRLQDIVGTSQEAVDRNLAAIVNQNHGQAPQFNMVAPSAPAVTAGPALSVAIGANNPTPATQPPAVVAEKVEVPVVASSNDTGLLEFATKWRDVFIMVCMGAVVLFTLKLYSESRAQMRIIERAMRASEDASFAARKSTQLVEDFIKKQEKAP